MDNNKILFSIIGIIILLIIVIFLYGIGSEKLKNEKLDDSGIYLFFYKF